MAHKKRSATSGVRRSAIVLHGMYDKEIFKSPLTRRQCSAKPAAKPRAAVKNGVLLNHFLALKGRRLHGDERLKVFVGYPPEQGSAFLSDSSKTVWVEGIPIKKKLTPT